MRIANVSSGPVPPDTVEEESPVKSKSKKKGSRLAQLISDVDFDEVDDLDDGEVATDEQCDRWNVDEIGRAHV